jgi:hypothetical protein
MHAAPAGFTSASFELRLQLSRRGHTTIASGCTSATCVKRLPASRVIKNTVHGEVNIEPHHDEPSSAGRSSSSRISSLSARRPDPRSFVTAQVGQASIPIRQTLEVDYMDEPPWPKQVSHNRDEICCYAAFVIRN